MFEDDDTTEEHERRITRCKSCNAKIIFLDMPSGKKMPVDADTVEPEDWAFDADKTLTDRQADVMALLCQGMTNKQIALTLGMSDKTIKGHVTKINEKMKTTTRLELVVKYYQARIKELTN